MIHSDTEIMEKLLDLSKNGIPKGYDINHIGFNLKFVKGGCTDITGYPFFGKSLVLKEILTSLAINHNWKFLLYMPDDGNNTEVAANFLHKIVGRSIGNYKDSLKEKEIVRYYQQLTERFKFVSKPFIEPKEFWDLAKEHKCNPVIDSWNYMAHNGDPTRPDYLRQILAYRNTFMQDNNLHSFIVIHPKNPDPMQVKEGNVKKPTVYNIMGGSEWNNNGRNIIVIHKTDKMDYNEPYMVSIDKVKPKPYGEVGEFYLHLDWAKQRFYTMDNNTQTKVYAYGESEELVDPMFNFETVLDDEPF